MCLLQGCGLAGYAQTSTWYRTPDKPLPSRFDQLGWPRGRNVTGRKKAGSKGGGALSRSAGEGRGEGGGDQPPLLLALGLRFVGHGHEPHRQDLALLEGAVRALGQHQEVLPGVPQREDHLAAYLELVE